MTIARRRQDALAAIAEPLPAPPTTGRTAPQGGVSVPRGSTVPVGDVPAADRVTPIGRLRRCTFRRIDLPVEVPGRSRASSYEVMCLYDDRDKPVSLGDTAAAAPICGACTNSGIFRPDED